jgi:hypothetical protein
VDWIHLAQDSVQRMAVVKMVILIRVAYNVGNNQVWTAGPVDTALHPRRLEYFHSPVSRTLLSTMSLQPQDPLYRTSGSLHGTTQIYVGDGGMIG